MGTIGDIPNVVIINITVLLFFTFSIISRFDFWTSGIFYIFLIIRISSFRVNGKCFHFYVLQSFFSFQINPKNLDPS